MRFPLTVHEGRGDDHLCWVLCKKTDVHQIDTDLKGQTTLMEIYSEFPKQGGYMDITGFNSHIRGYKMCLRNLCKTADKPAVSKLRECGSINCSKCVINVQSTDLEFMRLQRGALQTHLGH